MMTGAGLPKEVFDAVITLWKQRLGIDAQRLELLGWRLHEARTRMEARSAYLKRMLNDPEAWTARQRLLQWEEDKAADKRALIRAAEAAALARADAQRARAVRAEWDDIGQVDNWSRTTKQRAANRRKAEKARKNTASVKDMQGNFDWENYLHAHDYIAPDFTPQTSDLTRWESKREQAYNAIRDRVSHFHAGAE